MVTIVCENETSIQKRLRELQQQLQDIPPREALGEQLESFRRLLEQLHDRIMQAPEPKVDLGGGYIVARSEFSSIRSAPASERSRLNSQLETLFRRRIQLDNILNNISTSSRQEGFDSNQRGVDSNRTESAKVDKQIGMLQISIQETVAQMKRIKVYKRADDKYRESMRLQYTRELHTLQVQLAKVLTNLELRCRLEKEVGDLEAPRLTRSILG